MEARCRSDPNTNPSPQITPKPGVPCVSGSSHRRGAVSACERLRIFQTEERLMWGLHMYFNVMVGLGAGVGLGVGGGLGAGLGGA